MAHKTNSKKKQAKKARANARIKEQRKERNKRKARASQQPKLIHLNAMRAGLLSSALSMVAAQREIYNALVGDD